MRRRGRGGGEEIVEMILAFLLAMVVVLVRGQEEGEGGGGNGTTTTNNRLEDTTASSSSSTVELRRIDCEEPADCVKAEGSYCDLDLLICVCKPDYPVTDSKNCYKESKYEEFCRLDIQCQRLDKNSRCNLDLNVCQCQPRYEPQSFSKGRRDFWCVASTSTTNMAPGSYFDPALFGIMGGLVLMFIVLCVVLQMFAKAQFRDNRSIFNTPNPRLMNVSLIKDSKLMGGDNGGGNDGRGRISARQRQKYRQASIAAAAAAAAALQIGKSASSVLRVGDDDAAAAADDGAVVASTVIVVTAAAADGGSDSSVMEERVALIPSFSETSPHDAKDRKVSNCEESLSRELRRKGSPALLAGVSAGTSASVAGIQVLQEEEDNCVEIKDTQA